VPDALEDYEYYESHRTRSDEKRRRSSITASTDAYDISVEDPPNGKASKSKVTPPVVVPAVQQKKTPKKRPRDEAPGKSVESTIDAYNMTTEEVLTSNTSPLVGLDSRVCDIFFLI
jgi:hypothetical protein